MEQLTGHVFVETTLRRCNHGLVTTSDGVVMIDSPQRPTDGGVIQFIDTRRPRGRASQPSGPVRSEYRQSSRSNAPEREVERALAATVRQ